VVQYGCETLSLTFSEEDRLRVFENWVLSRIFGLKRDEVMGGWRQLYNEELHDLYSSPNMIRIIMLRRKRWAGHMRRIGREKVRGKETTRKTNISVVG
jgi:PAS domain-containing protein